MNRASGAREPITVGMLALVAVGCVNPRSSPEQAGERSPGLLEVAEIRQALTAPAGTEFQPNVKWGGRIQAVATSPGNLSFVLAGSESGGLFSSSDGGASFSHVETLRPVEIIDVAICPTNSSLVFVTALQNTRRRNRPASGTADNDGGIWLSTDGGASWGRPRTHAPAGVSYSAFGIAFGPSCNDVFIGTTLGLAISTDAGGAGGTNFTIDPIDAATPRQVISVIAQAGAGGAITVDIHHSGGGHRRSTTGGGNWSAIVPASGPVATALGLPDPTGLAGCHQLTAAGGRLFATSFDTVTVDTSTPPDGIPDVRQLSFATNQVYESDDGGASWSSLAVNPRDRNRDPFVYGVPSRTGSGSDVYYGDGALMQRQTCGNPTGLLCSTGPASWTVINIDSRRGFDSGSGPQNCLQGPNLCPHADPSSMAFNPTSHCPLYAGDDGGLMKNFPLDPSNPTATCGQEGTWRVSRGSGGTGGLNALQIYQIAGQVHPGTSTDLYFGTQDNDIWPSLDDGVTWDPNNKRPFEGLGFQLAHSAPDRTASPTITGMSCGACFNFRADAGLANQQGWPGPPRPRACPDTDGDNLCDACANRQASGACDAVSGLACNDADSNGVCDGIDCVDGDKDTFCDAVVGGETVAPVLLTGKTYVQWDGGQRLRGPGGAVSMQLYRSVDAGATWTSIATFPGATSGTNGDLVFDQARVGGAAAARVLYQPVFRTSGAVGLVRIDGAQGASPQLTTVDAPGSIGFIANLFDQSATVGVSAQNPALLIAADRDFGGMRRSTTSGASWSAIGGDPGMAQLGTLVTRNGEFDFRNFRFGGDRTQVTAIQFDDNDAQRILVGTEDAGIIASSDGGATWARLCRSERIPRVLTFFFDEVKKVVYASSFGRGLWKVDPSDRQVPVFTVPPGNATAGNCGAVNVGRPRAEDPCEGPSVPVTIAVAASMGSATGCESGTGACGNFTAGTTLLTWTATDAYGDRSLATSTVTVTDITKPTITAPAARTITVCTNADIGQATASDGCGAVRISNDKPAKFALGTTTVTWTATDAAGNKATSTQLVTAVLGDSTTCCPTGTNVIVGSGASNQLVGTEGSDCILGLGGDDIIDGRGGNDFISGGAGNDTISGGFGNDVVFGGAGNDTIDSGPGDDRIDGGDGVDTCAGSTGTNVIVACEVKSGG